MAAVPAAPTDSSDDAARTATAFRRRGEACGAAGHAAARQLALSKPEGPSTVGRGAEGLARSATQHVFEDTPVLRNGAQDLEQGANRMAGERAYMWPNTMCGL